MQIGNEVYTESGQKAVFAGEIDGKKFVRLIMEADGEEWPSDSLTQVSRIFADEPRPIRGKAAAEVEERIANARDEEAAVRRSVMALQKQERELLAAMAKHPEIALAVDFLEGRITHVVVDKYDEIKVSPLQDVLANHEDGWGGQTENGLKLLCLFGHEKNKSPRWAINRYYDGSGHYTTIDPYHSEEDARAEVQRRADAEFDLWRRGEKALFVHRFLKSGVSIPQDYLDHIATKKTEAVAAKIEKLRQEIASLEAIHG